MATPLYVDYHNHTTLCHHATGTVDEYLARATQLGIREFGFSEHSHWMIRPDARNLCPSREEMALYLQWMEQRREKFDGKGGRPRLRVGLEADWVPERLDEAREFIASHDFDYVYGSVHHIREPETGEYVSTWWFRSDDIDAVYRTYFAEMEKLALSGLCDILAHIDVIRRSRKVPPGGTAPYIEQILPSILRAGVAVEINSSGRDHANGDFFPEPRVLAMLVAAGVPITFGSDSHAASHVGRYREEVVEYFRACGGREVALFEKRRRTMMPL